MNWSSKVEFCAIRVSKKGKHGVHFVVPFLGPLFGHHVVNKQFVWSPKRYHYVVPFWGPFLKLFCFLFQLFLKSGGLDGRDGGCGGGGGGEGGGGGVCRIC